MEKDYYSETAELLERYKVWKATAKALTDAQNYLGEFRVSDETNLQQVEKQRQTVRETRQAPQNTGGSGTDAQPRQTGSTGSGQPGAGSGEPSPRKRRKGGWLVALLVVALLAGAAAGVWFKVHIWTEPTCVTAPVFRICGIEGGPALDHDWMDATLETPMTCRRCSVTQGNPISPVVSLTINQNCVFVLRADGSVEVMGDGYQQDAAAQWSNIHMLKAGQCHVVGLRTDGTVVAAGSTGNHRTQVSQWENAISIAAGEAHTVALRQDGTVAATGYNYDGQCDVSLWSGIVAIAAGDHHTVGLRTDGTVVATGRAAEGQCAVTEWTEIVMLQAGANHTVGLRADGTVLVAGGEPEIIYDTTLWTEIVSIATGPSHIVGLRKDGTAVATGSDHFGQCQVEHWYGLVALEAGNTYTLGLCQDGSILAAGSDDHALVDFMGWTGNPGPLMEPQLIVPSPEGNGVHRYTLHVMDCSWEEAFDYARDMGGHLLRIDTPEEWAYVTDLIESMGYRDFHFFLSGQRESGSTGYYWLDNSGSPAGSQLNTEQHWAAELWLEGEPSFAYEDVQEYCMEMHFDALQGWCWNDVPSSIADAPVAFIVEYED